MYGLVHAFEDEWVGEYVCDVACQVQPGRDRWNRTVVTQADI